MPTPIALPDIRLYFSGLLILGVKDGGPHCQVGIVKPDFMPGHFLTFDVKEITNGVKRSLPLLDPAEIKDNEPLLLKLDPPGSVKLFKHERGHEPKHGAGHEALQHNPEDNDFKWVVNLEQVYGHGLKVKREALRSIFTINGGEYFTLDISKDKVKFIKKHKEVVEFDPEFLRTGTSNKVALLIGGNIILDRPGASATLMLGQRVLYTFKRKEGTWYEISLGLNRPQPHTHDKKDNDNDFHDLCPTFDTQGDPHHYDPELDDGRERSSPDARCTTPNFGTTGSIETT